MINEKDKSMNDELVKDIQVRLRKIQGQVKGIEKMVTSEVLLQKHIGASCGSKSRYE